MAMPAIPDANDFLMQGGVPSVSFDRPIGHTVTGIIVRYPEVVQRTEYQTNKPMYWDDNTPQMQLRVLLATDERDPSSRDDDGVRALYARHHMKDAIRDAVKAAGARLDVGGRLTVTYVGDAPPKTAGAKPSKLFSAQYIAPAAAAVDALLFDTGPTHPGAPAAFSAPAMMPPGQFPAPYPAYPTPPAAGAPAYPNPAVPGPVMPWAASPAISGQPAPTAFGHPAPGAPGHPVPGAPGHPAPAPAHTAGAAMREAPAALESLTPDQLERLNYSPPAR
ncbi:hypothetical protein GCM10022226_61920 [Sphaerisporangium flaviroseum]|uniref:Uncharacterized protein n=1 Tax=Sphaerisporangium flaviroseum TaxID=509199 RepID=A0ABP7J1I4_9ACTN